MVVDLNKISDLKVKARISTLDKEIKEFCSLRLKEKEFLEKCLSGLEEYVDMTNKRDRPKYKDNPQMAKRLRFFDEYGDVVLCYGGKKAIMFTDKYDARDLFEPYEAPVGKLPQPTKAQQARNELRKEEVDKILKFYDEYRFDEEKDSP